MERKIGDVFTFDGKQLEVLEGRAGCIECYFFNKACVSIRIKDIRGECCLRYRKDKKDVYFKLVEE